MKSSREFANVYENGRSRGNRTLVLYVLRNQTDSNTLGLVVSKKVGNSVVRHRLRRLMKENYRLMESRLNAGYDMIFIAKTSAKEATYSEIGEAMTHLLRKSGIIKEDEIS